MPRLPTPASPLEGLEKEYQEKAGALFLRAIRAYSKDEFSLIETELKNLIAVSLSRAFEEGRKHEKTGTFATCDAEGCSETLGLKPYQTGFEMLCSVHGSPCPVDPRCTLPRPHSHEL